MKKLLILTNKIIKKGVGINGVLTKQQVAILGGDMSKKGWRRRLIGKPVSPSTIKHFLAKKETAPKAAEYFYKNGQKIRNSKAEDLIMNWLIENDIDYEQEKIFDDCINPLTFQRLKFDFWIPNHNTCIEYDGKQHFMPQKIFNDDIEKFKRRIYRDAVKDIYCNQKKIRLIRIAYPQFDDIIHILETSL